jgi:hypothetical protein
MSGCLDQLWEITEVLEADSVPQLMWVKQCHKAPMTGNGKHNYHPNIYLVGGLEHEFYVSIYWEFHHPN